MSTPSPTTRMDVARRRDKPVLRRRPLLVGGAVAIVLGTITVMLSELKAAAPAVDRASIWIDTVKRGEMIRQVQGLGTLVPEQIRFLSATTAARVQRIIKKPGARVHADAVLLELSNPELELAALEAERQVARSSAELANLQASQRNQRLAQQSIVSTVRSELNQSRRQATADEALAKRGFLSSLEMAQSRGKADELQARLGFEQRRLAALADGMAAQLSAQRAQLERLRSIAAFRRREVLALQVRAGVEGVLQELPLQVGQWVQPGMLLAKVARPDRLKAEIRIAEVRAKDVQVGQPAVVDTRNGLIPGTVARIDPAVVAGYVRVEVKLGGPLPRGARPDLSVEGTIELERLEDVLYVGRPAFGPGEGAVSFFKLTSDGSHAERVAARLGRSSVRTVEIRGGLREGDQVILSDLSRWDSEERIRLQ